MSQRLKPISAPSSQSTTNNEHVKSLILVQPIAESIDSVGSTARAVSDLIGIDLYTVRQKLAGWAPETLCFGNDISQLKNWAQSLRTLGIQCACVDGALLRSRVNIRRATTIRAIQGGIAFLDVNGDTIAEHSSFQPVLVTIGSMSPGKYAAGGPLMRAVVGAAPGDNSITAAVKNICRNRPALILQCVGCDPVFIDATQFDYSFLGDAATLSSTQNALKMIASFSKNDSWRIDTSFGARTLPIDTLASRPTSAIECQSRFELYSRLMYLADQDGFYATNSATPRIDTNNAEPDNTIPGVQQDDPSAVLPPPPAAESSRSVFGMLSMSPALNLKEFGPPIVTKISAGVFTLLLFSELIFDVAVNSGWLFMIAGIWFGVWAVSLALRKREIEQLPTSKIRSVPMGTVEITGNARRKYSLTAPFSGVKCVYYHYKIMRLKNSGVVSEGQPTKQWVTEEIGQSGLTPFYVQDETGRALIDPKGAIFGGLQTEEYSHSMLEMLAGVAPERDRKIIESVIPEDATLYVIGHARPIKNLAEKERQEKLDKIRALKRDPQTILKYDLDGDGELSFEEWERARQDLEQQILEDKLSEESIDDTFLIGEHPHKGLFYISDKAEPDVINGLKWRIPAVAIVASITLIISIARLFG